MSTQIYDSFKVTGDVFQLSEDFRKYLDPVYTDIIYRQYATDIISLVDEATIIASVCDKPTCTFLFDNAKNRNESPNISWSFFKHKKTGLTLVSFFGDNRAFADITTAFPQLVDFHYQNSTDQPDNITDQEWDFRKTVWDDIHTGASTPAVAGLSATLWTKCTVPHYFDTDQIVAAMPDFSKRVAKQAKNVLCNEYLKKYSDGSNSYTAQCFNALDYLSTHPQLTTYYAKNLEMVLTKVVTSELLGRKLSEFHSTLTSHQIALVQDVPDLN